MIFKQEVHVTPELESCGDVDIDKALLGSLINAFILESSKSQLKEFKHRLGIIESKILYTDKVE